MNSIGVRRGAAHFCRCIQGIIAMKLPLLLSIIVVLCLLLGGSAAQAQTEQYWPEIDTYIGINSHMRFSLFAAKTKEEKTTTDGEIGPNFDFYFQRLREIKSPTGMRLDQSKSRRMMFRIGYRYLPSTGSTTNRLFFEVTGRHYFKSGLLIADRNRGEVNFVEGESYWRYRNRISFERTLEIAGYEFTPYARAEFYYDSRYSKFSRTALDAGCVFPFWQRFEFEPYYEHQNDTAKSPNRQVDAFGIVLSMYFRTR